MLIVTRSDKSDCDVTLKLEGKLLEPWIVVLQSACRESLATSGRVCLDLGDLTFIDEAGAGFLTGLIHEGARVVACSGFVAEMLCLNER